MNRLYWYWYSIFDISRSAKLYIRVISIRYFEREWSYQALVFGPISSPLNAVPYGSVRRAVLGSYARPHGRGYDTIHICVISKLLACECVRRRTNSDADHSSGDHLYQV